MEKSGLVTGTRLGAEREYEFDELEVHASHPSKAAALDPVIASIKLDHKHAEIEARLCSTEWLPLIPIHLHCCML